MRNYIFVLAVIGTSLITASCSNAQLANTDTQPGVDQSRAQSPAPSTAQASAQATPSKEFTAADVAKLKWIEGTWRCMNGDKPFYERYKIEETAMVVETLKADGSVDGAPDRFELKDGEFGKDEGDKRSVASEITADHIQFVPAVPGKMNNFRFERQPNNTWRAVLDWPAKGDKPARQRIYIMEPWKP
jgi:hypothetical protein